MPINETFLGTWELDISKNQGLVEYGEAMGYNEEQIKLYKALQFSFSVTLEGDTYKLEVDFKGKLPNSAYSIKEGETIDFTSADGRSSKVTLTTEDGNTCEKYETTDKGVTWVTKRTIDGDVMTAVTTSGEATMTQFLTRVKETSYK